jgi:hypothetical protein
LGANLNEKPAYIMHAATNCLACTLPGLFGPITWLVKLNDKAGIGLLPVPILWESLWKKFLLKSGILRQLFKMASDSFGVLCFADCIGNKTDIHRHENMSKKMSHFSRNI